MYRHEWVLRKMALPQLPRRFTRGFHVNEADLRFYPELPRLPQIVSSFMMYRHEWVPPKTALPHLPRRFTRDLHVNKADLHFYSEIPRLPHIT